jgi:ATP-binding cassette subfamily B protein
MTNCLHTICWPAARLGEALELLGRRAGFPVRSLEALRPPGWLLAQNGERLLEWLEIAAGSLGLEAKATDAAYAGVKSLVQGCGPALLRLVLDGEQVFLAVMRGGRGSVLVLTPDLKRKRVRVETIRAALCGPLEQELLPEISRLLDAAGIRGRRRDSVGASILRERLSAVPVQGCWLLRMPASSSLLQQLRENGLMVRLTGFVAAHTVDTLLLIGAWWMIGRAVLSGRLDYGWLVAWALVLLTRIPF